MNQKGFYNDNKDWTTKLRSFFKESGFYIMIVIGLCVLAVGAVYFTTNHLLTSPEDYEDDLVPYEFEAEADDNNEVVIIDDNTEPVNEPYTGQYQSQDDDRDSMNIPEDTGDNLIAQNNEQAVEDNDTEVVNVAKPTETPAPTKAPEKPKEDKKAEEDKQSQEVIKPFDKKPSFIMPVDGKISTDYAMDRLLYSKTLDEWRTHSGVDIEAPRGEAVKAAADGYIKEIKNDPCYGITIVIDHENGYKTIYSNLASDSMVSTNQKVKAGDAISSVGNTAIFECMDPPHLHFEIVKDDKVVDPKTLLSVSND